MRWIKDEKEKRDENYKERSRTKIEGCVKRRWRKTN